jgi:hypothetical protein
MRKVTLTYGLLAGAIISAFMLFGMILLEKGATTFDNSELIGYGSMVIALSMIFFGIKSYRDNYQNGAIKFGKALQVGLLITLVASLLYAVAGEAFYQIDPEGQTALTSKYGDYQVAKMKESGASPAAIEQKANEMAEMMEMYKTPLLRFVMTLAIILPVGIIVTLISAAVLKRKELLPA